MHEYPITLEIIRLAENAALGNGAAKVRKIALVIGDLSGYVGDSVSMYFGEISRGTLCEGADLEIRRVKSQVQCAVCGQVFERKPFSFACPSCGGDAHPTKTGTEFYIEYIETDDDGGSGYADGQQED
jgi:hydrogenase nickel incorporation protein HypA/HybF